MDDSLRLRAHRARAGIRSGALRGPALLALLESVPALHRDAWVDELLGTGEPPDDMPRLPRGAVPYLPCGVAEIVAAVRAVPLGPRDVFVDVGAGLGRVVMLAHLLSGARACGVEVQEPLVRRARECCAALGLEGVEFVHADAAEVDLEGTVFFLYAPCNGELLARVLRRIEGAARRRPAPVAVCAVDLEFRGVPWLRRRSAPSLALTVYESRAEGGIAPRG